MSRKNANSQRVANVKITSILAKKPRLEKKICTEMMFVMSSCRLTLELNTLKFE